MVMFVVSIILLAWSVAMTMHSIEEFGLRQGTGCIIAIILCTINMALQLYFAIFE
jgi:hypothetical protein